jgi:hypothetical protein
MLGWKPVSPRLCAAGELYIKFSDVTVSLYADVEHQHKNMYSMFVARSSGFSRPGRTRS